jgi:DNA topoisomerase-3
MTERIVERAKNFGTGTVPGDYATLSTPCPACGGVVKENYKRFACTKCDFSITKIAGSRLLAPEEADALLRDRTIGPLQGFRSKMGRPFAAILKLTADNKLEFDFGQADAEAEGAEPVDFSGQTRLGDCPKCGAGVYEHGMAYVCEKSVGPEKTCDFRSGKIILQQEIEPAQMSKLLAEGRTDLLQGFVSQRTRRKFKAFLVRGADGKVGFEFEPRPAKPGAGGKSPGKAGGAKAGAAAEAGAAVADSGKPAAKTAARKPAAKKPAAKKPAAKTAAKKPAARKPAAKRAPAAK